MYIHMLVQKHEYIFTILINQEWPNSMYASQSTHYMRKYIIWSIKRPSIIDFALNRMFSYYSSNYPIYVNMYRFVR